MKETVRPESSDTSVLDRSALQAAMVAPKSAPENLVTKDSESDDWSPGSGVQPLERKSFSERETSSADTPAPTEDHRTQRRGKFLSSMTQFTHKLFHKDSKDKKPEYSRTVSRDAEVKSRSEVEVEKSLSIPEKILESDLDSSLDPTPGEKATQPLSEVPSSHEPLLGIGSSEVAPLIPGVDPLHVHAFDSRELNFSSDHGSLMPTQPRPTTSSLLEKHEEL